MGDEEGSEERLSQRQEGLDVLRFSLLAPANHDSARRDREAK
jgi:hypothetical protein